MKHTAGPWRVTIETYPTIKGDVTISSTITDDCIAKLPKEWVNKKNNAKLIAASPELLKALQGCLHHNDAVKDEYKLPASLVRRIQAAIDAAI